MTTIHHVNGGWLQVPPGPRVPCHCLLLEDRGGLALVDAGIGLRDVRDPLGRIGREAIDMAGFRFAEEDTAFAQLERAGFRPADVAHVILTHADPDHAGGLADFPAARVHVAAEEKAALASGDARYRPPQFDHGPEWQEHGPSGRRWYGLEARELPLGFASEVLLIPLFGHTLGQCGVAIRQGDRWVLHVADAYYLRVELSTDEHPVSRLAALRAADDAMRRASLERLRRIARDHGSDVTMLGYHDITEFPPGTIAG
jgi:glyoxylase-like metal-dependent hydrolase (beta-lactamase superfamily II)